jgi:hypothetical protein
MEISKRNGRVILTYEEDGSEWLFTGFVEKSGYRYMRLLPIERSSTWPAIDAKEFAVELDDDDYTRMVEALNYHFPAGRAWTSPDLHQATLDAFTR